MPSPIAHISMAWLVWRWVKQHRSLAGAWVLGHPLLLLAACVGFSLLPDIDFLPGILTGDARGYHNYFTHSLVVAVLLALLLAGIVKALRKPGAGIWFVVSGTCYGLHVLLDGFTWGKGVMVFWPFSAWRFYSKFLIFHGLRWSEGWVAPAHLVTLVNELIFVLLVVLVVHILTRLRKRSGAIE